MNDSPYGLTASVWTNAEKNAESQEVFLKLADELESGTVFLNRRVESCAVWKKQLMEST
jgi:acyl-CoA reductase-like NAD-dependent aldehyde dehydrogenase